MGSADPVDDQTFNGSFSEEGVAKLKERVKVRLKEYMGDYTDDILVEYVIVLLKNGRRKEEANNELKIFLGGDSDSFVAWLWDHLAESFDEYFTTSHVEEATVSSQNEDKSLVQMDSESEKGPSRARRRSQLTNSSDIPPNYEKRDHRQKHRRRSPSPESHSHRRRSKTNSLRNEQGETKPNVSRRLLQFAMRDALATSTPPNCSTEPSLKRLRSVVSTSTQDSSDPDPAQKILSVARAVNPMATVTKAVPEAAEDAKHKNPKSGRSVFDRISHTTGFSDQHMVLGSSKNEECMNFSGDQETVERHDNNGVYVENMTAFDTGLQPNFAFDGSRFCSSVNLSHPNTFPGNRISNPKSLQHRLVDGRFKGTNYQNHLTEIATKQKTAGFSGNTEVGRKKKLEEQMNIPEVGLHRYVNGGRSGSSEGITESSTETKKSVPGTLSTTRSLEDASSRTIFVANVHFAATKDSLSRHFNKRGEVLKAVIVTDPATGQPSGSAYIEFTRKEAAENALSLDGTSFMSRILKIVKGSNVQQQEVASSVTWSRGGRYARASPYRGGAFRGRSGVRGGARSMQWKRESAESGSNIVAPNAPSMTNVRTESQSEFLILFDR